jgi:hypothetical protein
VRIEFTKTEVRDLIKVLKDAEEQARGRAVYESLLAQAMKEIRYRTLVQTHQHRWTVAIATADKLETWHKHLEYVVTTAIEAPKRPVPELPVIEAGTDDE